MKLVAKNIAGIQGIHFNLGADGKVNGFDADIEVNMGTMSLPFNAKMWHHLNDTQKVRVQQIYDAIITILNKMVITDELPVD